jgi:hypothetical protein
MAAMDFLPKASPFTGAGFFILHDPYWQRLTPFLERKGKSYGIRHQENSERLYAGF